MKSTVDLLNVADEKIGFLVAVTSVEASEIFAHPAAINGLCAMLESISLDIQQAVIALRKEER